MAASTFALWREHFSRQPNQGGATTEVFKQQSGSPTPIKSQDDDVSAQISGLKAANEAMRKDIEKLKLDAMQGHEIQSRLRRIEGKFNEGVSFE